MKNKSTKTLKSLNIKQINKLSLAALKGGSEGGYNVGDLDTENGFDD